MRAVACSSSDRNAMVASSRCQGAQRFIRGRGSRLDVEPAAAVHMHEAQRVLGTGAAGVVELRRPMSGFPGGQDRVDPGRGRLDLVAAHEGGLVVAAGAWIDPILAAWE